MKKLLLEIAPTLQALYECDIDFAIRARPELGFEWEIGLDSKPEQHMIGVTGTFGEAVLDLAEAAHRLYPTSEFAIAYGKKRVV